MSQTAGMRRLIVPSDIVNRVYVPYLTDRHRYQLYFGGAGSGKSVFLATRCLLDALAGRNILIVRKVARTLRASCWNECVKAMARLGLESLFDVNKTENVITSRSNGAQILFAGLDDAEKIKSLTPKTGVLTDIWIEEATECAYTDMKQLDKRLRGQTRHEKRLTLSFNPVSRSHWIHSTFFGIWEDGKSSAADGSVSILKTTYLDNAYLTDDDRAAMENERDPYFRAVYTLGEWASPKGAVFTRWRVEDLSAVVPRYSLRHYGLDFGFSSDPSAFVECALDKREKRVYVFRELCARDLPNDVLYAMIAPVCRSDPVICDSADPRSIQELRRLGLCALPAKKGPDSVAHGLHWLRAHEIVIDKGCPNLKRELTDYKWLTDASGEPLPKPEDKNNHLIDALRYALECESTGKIARTGT